MKKQIQNPFAVATSQAKKLGYSNFTEGSFDDDKRDEIAEAIKEEKMIKAFSTLGMLKQTAGPPRKGLVPQSGDWQHPGRWVLPGKEGGESTEAPKLNGISGESGPPVLNFDEFLKLLNSGSSRLKEAVLKESDERKKESLKDDYKLISRILKLALQVQL